MNSAIVLHLKGTFNARISRAYGTKGLHFISYQYFVPTGNVIKLNVEGVVVLVPLLLKPCLTQIFHLVA